MHDDWMMERLFVPAGKRLEGCVFFVSGRHVLYSTMAFVVRQSVSHQPDNRNPSHVVDWVSPYVSATILSGRRPSARFSSITVILSVTTLMSRAIASYYWK